MAEFEKDLRKEDAIHKLKEKKKKKEEELRSLEVQKKKEIEETEKEIKIRTVLLEKETEKKAQTEEQAVHELTAERDRIREELVAVQASLEEIVGKETPAEPSQQIEYMIEALKSEEAPLYSVTNYNVYKELQEIRNKAAAGEYLTSQEREFVDETRRQTRRFITEDDYLTEKDPNDYVTRSEDILRQIDTYVNLRKKER